MGTKNIRCYTCKSKLVPGRGYSEVAKIARAIYNNLQSSSKRRPYIRSAYFNKDKIFLDNYWPHLNQKNPRDRKRRLKFFECAIELIQSSKGEPIYEMKDVIAKEALYRFVGRVNNQYFVVQIKEDLKRKQKFLMSVFEYNI